jgi:hypothetical protein
MSTERIIFVHIANNQHLNKDFWQLGWIGADNQYLRSEWFNTFKEAFYVAKRYPKAKLFVKTQAEEYALDSDSQEVMDLLRYC